MAKRKKPSLGTPADLEAELRTGWVRRSDSDTPAPAEKPSAARPATAKPVTPAASQPEAAPAPRSAPAPSAPVASAPVPRPEAVAPARAARSTPSTPASGLGPISRSLDFISIPLQVGLVLLLAPFGVRSRPL